MAVAQKLSKKIIDDIPLPPAGPLRLHDSGARGLHLRSSPGGARTWFLTYRNGANQKRDLKIGRYPDLVPETARQIAHKALGEIAAGNDPAGDKRARAKAPTINDLADRYMREHVATKLKPSTQELYRSTVDLHIRPHIGRICVSELAKSDVAKMSGAMSASPRQANLSVAVVSSMMSCAIDWALRPDGVNPAAKVKKYPEKKRNRFLTETEFRRLWKVLDEEPLTARRTDAGLALKLALITGRRIGEILHARWGDLDLAAGRMRLPDSKVGAITFHLSADAVALLEPIKRERGDTASSANFIIRGKIPGKPFAGIQKAWQRIRKKADLLDVRIHDLRHSYASFAAAEGCDILRINEMLGHMSIQTNQRYAHLTNNAVRSSVNILGDALGRLSVTT